MKAQILVNGDRQKFNAIAQIKKLNYDEPHEVTIKPFRQDRSLAQNRLAFKWYKERADQIHNTPEHERNYCKLHYGCPILMVVDTDFAEIFMDAIHHLPYDQQLKAMEYLPVTRLMKVKEFSEYLNTVEMMSATEGVRLSRPDDLYWQAMGVSNEEKQNATG